MTIRFDPEANTWFYRVARGGRRYFKGGFPNKRLAEDAQAKLLDMLIKGEVYPERVGRFMLFEEGSQWFFEEYSVRRKRSWKNDRARIGVLKKFFHGLKLSGVTPERIDDLKDHLRNDLNLSRHTVNHYLALLKTIFNRLRKRRKYFGENPVAYVEMERVPRARVRFLYPSEEKVLTPAAKADQSLWPYYYNGIHTGMRLQENCNMRVRDVDLVRLLIFVPNSKTDRSRYVPVSPDLAVFLQEQIKGKKPDDFVLGNHHFMTVSHWFSDLCDEIGLGDVTFHVLRHTFAAVLLGKGEPIYKVSKILGHSSIDVTEKHYGHLDTKVLQGVVSQIDGFLSETWQPNGSQQFATTEK